MHTAARHSAEESARSSEREREEDDVFVGAGVDEARTLAGSVSMAMLRLPMSPTMFSSSSSSSRTSSAELVCAVSGEASVSESATEVESSVFSLRLASLRTSSAANTRRMSVTKDIAGMCARSVRQRVLIARFAAADAPRTSSSTHCAAWAMRVCFSAAETEEAEAVCGRCGSEAAVCGARAVSADGGRWRCCSVSVLLSVSVCSGSADVDARRDDAALLSACGAAACVSVPVSVLLSECCLCGCCVREYRAQSPSVYSPKPSCRRVSHVCRMCCTSAVRKSVCANVARYLFGVLGS